VPTQVNIGWVVPLRDVGERLKPLSAVSFPDFQFVHGILSLECVQSIAGALWVVSGDVKSTQHFRNDTDPGVQSSGTDVVPVGVWLGLPLSTRRRHDLLELCAFGTRYNRDSGSCRTCNACRLEPMVSIDALMADGLGSLCWRCFRLIS
jgi:hypothetical protein